GRREIGRKSDKARGLSHFGMGTMFACLRHVGRQPIAKLLPALSKVFEKLIVKKFILPLVKNKVDYSQFAYISRPGSGTTCALVLTYHKILEFLDRHSGAVRLLSIDFSKAFDKLLHSTILSACSYFSFPPFLMKWIVSFLSSRTQRVCFADNVSSWSAVTSGIPQGSILGPVLFCLAINSLSPLCSNSMYVKYADDVSVLHFVRDSIDDDLQTEWEHIVQWSVSVSLPINFLKCKVLNIVTKQDMCLSEIVLSDGTTLDEVQSLSFLGVILSHDMKWNAHINRTVKKACKRMFIMYNLRRSGCSEQLIFQSYCAFIRSVLLYAFPAWCNVPAYLSWKLCVVERRVMRIIGSSTLFPSLLDVAEKTCFKLMKSVFTFDSHPLRTMFKTRPVINTRSSLHLYAPFTRTTRFKKSFIKYCKFES
ncbi:MAG: reverse transcriptase family protein, partial [Pseudomonadota bacterium]